MLKIANTVVTVEGGDTHGFACTPEALENYLKVFRIRDLICIRRDETRETIFIPKEKATPTSSVEEEIDGADDELSELVDLSFPEIIS